MNDFKAMFSFSPSIPRNILCKFFKCIIGTYEHICILEFCKAMDYISLVFMNDKKKKKNVCKNVMIKDYIKDIMSRRGQDFGFPKIVNYVSFA